MENNSNKKWLFYVMVITTFVTYVVNFIQMLIHFSNENWSTAFVKLIGAGTVWGSLFTVWF